MSDCFKIKVFFNLWGKNPTALTDWWTRSVLNPLPCLKLCACSGKKVYPSLSGGIETSGRQHQQIGRDCRRFLLFQTYWEDWVVLFCVPHIERLKVFGAPEEINGDNRRHTNPSPHLTRASAFHSHAASGSGAANQSHLTQESSSHRGRGQCPLRGH